MIDREHVLNVARLARLQLSPEEVDSMLDELNEVLGHVDRIVALDFHDVEPTSHVVDLVNVLRDDVPRHSLTPEQALANAPDPDPDTAAFRVPSPQA